MILRGEVLGWDGHGEAHRASPMDCIYIPASVPHGIRCYGDEPVDLIWIHDAIERKGISVYWNERMRNPQDESKDEIKGVPFKDLEPSWAAGHAENPGQMHSMINWVGGVKGSTNFNPKLAVPNDKAALGLTVIQSLVVDSIDATLFCSCDRRLRPRFSQSCVYLVSHSRCRRFG